MGSPFTKKYFICVFKEMFRIRSMQFLADVIYLVCMGFIRNFNKIEHVLTQIAHRINYRLLSEQVKLDPRCKNP